MHTPTRIKELAQNEMKNMSPKNTGPNYPIGDIEKSIMAGKSPLPKYPKKMGSIRKSVIPTGGNPLTSSNVT